MDFFDRDHDNYVPYVPNNDDSDNSNLKILYIAMVSFVVVLFVVFFLYLYARCIFTRRSRNRAAVRRLTLAALHVSDIDAAHRRTEPSNMGLDPAIIALLPTFTMEAKIFKDSSDNSDPSSVMECVVCLSALESEEKVKLLPNCKHFFHVNCIDTWLGSHSTCPLCRAEVKPRLQPHDREGPTAAVAPDHDHGSLMFDGVNNNSDNNDNGECFKSNGSNSRLSSFRMMLSRERSSRRVQPHGHGDEDGGVDHDLERQ